MDETDAMFLTAITTGMALIVGLVLGVYAERKRVERRLGDTSPVPTPVARAQARQQMRERRRRELSPIPQMGDYGILEAEELEGK